MISNVEISGHNLELSAEIKKYVGQKIGRLDKYMPRHARKSVFADVKIRQTNNNLGNKYECEAILHLPGEQIQAKEATLNMFAAVDIVEHKLKNQLVKYKTAHINGRTPGILGRIKARFF